MRQQKDLSYTSCHMSFVYFPTQYDVNFPNLFLRILNHLENQYVVPYLGTREFSASFRLVDPGSEDLTSALSADQGGNRDLGIMLYDMDFSNPKDIQAMFYRTEMKEGVIIVPPLDSEEILR